MVVKTRKQGNSITITIPSGEIIFTPEELDHQVSYVSDDDFNLKLDTNFDEYDDVFKALVEK